MIATATLHDRYMTATARAVGGRGVRVGAGHSLAARAARAVAGHLEEPDALEPMLVDKEHNFALQLRRELINDALARRGHLDVLGLVEVLSEALAHGEGHRGRVQLEEAVEVVHRVPEVGQLGVAVGNHLAEDGEHVPASRCGTVWNGVERRVAVTVCNGV